MWLFVYLTRWCCSPITSGEDLSEPPDTAWKSGWRLEVDYTEVELHKLFDATLSPYNTLLWLENNQDD